MTPREKWAGLGRRLKWTAWLSVVMILAFPVCRAHAAAHWTVPKLVAHAHGNPFNCKVASRWGVKQNRCVVAVVFRGQPALGRETASVISCESGWDETQVTPPLSATGLGQFLPGTWRSLARYYREPMVQRRSAAFRRYVKSEGAKVARHSAKHPVWNVRGMKLLRAIYGGWQQWSCRP